jgi:kynureninase
VKEAFSRFLGADPGRLHVAAHSHHPWPDVTFDAHLRAWEDAARLMDDKWDHVFGRVFPSARRRVAAILGLPDPDTLVFAPNTHEFILRIASNLPVPFRVLTTDSEFHSFARQLNRWEEEGIAIPTRVPAQPYDTFPDRFTDLYAGHELVFFSHVHFDSGYVVDALGPMVASFAEATTVVIDGYHGFMALPTDLAAVSQRAFYLAGGYKYAMAGEGACFLHVPASAPTRPIETGWWAGFGALTEAATGVPYATGGQRFGGATSDPSGIYRLDAVLAWLEEEGITVAHIHRRVVDLQRRLLASLEPKLVDRLVPDDGVEPRGHFLTFEMGDAAAMYGSMHDRGVVTDYRGSRWRVGLGLYHDENDVDRLVEEINAVTT